jgi:hypothetical protein
VQQVAPPVPSSTGMLTLTLSPHVTQIYNNNTQVSCNCRPHVCRVCGDTDLEPWVDTLLPAVPILLSIIGANSAPDSRKVPLLFFGMSSLVRMATLPAVAQAVQQQGGLPKLVAALHVVPAAICQVRPQCTLLPGGGGLDGGCSGAKRQHAVFQAVQQQWGLPKLVAALHVRLLQSDRYGSGNASAGLCENLTVTWWAANNSIVPCSLKICGGCQLDAHHCRVLCRTNLRSVLADPGA